MNLPRDGLTLARYLPPEVTSQCTYRGGGGVTLNLYSYKHSSLAIRLNIHHCISPYIQFNVNITIV